MGECLSLLTRSGTALEKEEKVRDAARAYASILPYLSDLPPKIASILEHQLWTQRLLIRYLSLTSRFIMSHCNRPGELFSSAPLVAPGSLFSSFRAYASFYETRDPAFDRMFPYEMDGNPHLHAWKAYYDAISIMIQHDIVEPVFKSRSQQSAELKRVEGVYIGLLLKETEFPRAEQENYQIEVSVDSVIANWRALCGRSWKDEDLGDGGKASLGRGVLEVCVYLGPKSSCRQSAKNSLYRFSTKHPPKPFIPLEFYDISLQYIWLLLIFILLVKLLIPILRCLRRAKQGQRSLEKLN